MSVAGGTWQTLQDFEVIMKKLGDDSLGYSKAVPWRCPWIFVDWRAWVQKTELGLGLGRLCCFFCCHVVFLYCTSFSQMGTYFIKVVLTLIYGRAVEQWHMMGRCTGRARIMNQFMWFLRPNSCWIAIYIPRCIFTFLGNELLTLCDVLFTISSSTIKNGRMRVMWSKLLHTVQWLWIYEYIYI